MDFPALSGRVFCGKFDVLDLQGHTENLLAAHATDPEGRRSGSGGMVTALVLHLLEHQKIDGAVVVDFDRDNLTQARVVLATTAEQIRYASLRGPKRRRLLLKLLLSPVGDFLGPSMKSGTLFGSYRHKK